MYELKMTQFGPTSETEFLNKPKLHLLRLIECNYHYEKTEH